MDAAARLLDRLHRNRAGEQAGITSVCSAHPMVLATAMRRAAGRDAMVLIEATCNQVNQDGGYTGMTPAAFRDRQRELAATQGLAADRLLLGGDHLGPNPWRALPAADAMTKADILVAAYAAAGYRKLHLDASMACADDPAVLPAELIADRAARLCAIAERAAADAGQPPPLYVVGTEVPTPGGSREAEEHLTVTPSQEVAHTLALHRSAFAARGLEAAFQRVVGIVVQPGVEFGQDSVHDFVPAAAQSLSAALKHHACVVFEAHSTDYQRDIALHALVAGHFAILKVGPELTFALREALFALDAIADAMWPERRAGVRDTVTTAMANQPRWWHGYHAPEDRVGQVFSLSDRVRYYWPDANVAASVARLLAELAMAPIPPTLVSQYLPAQYAAWRAEKLALTPEAMLRHRVGAVLDRYGAACGEAGCISAR